MENNQVVIKLDVSLQRGDQVIDSISLRKPVAGELRGIALANLLQMDVDALKKLLPRISTPILTEADVLKMDAGDLTDAAIKVSGFLLKKAERQELESVIE